MTDSGVMVTRATVSWGSSSLSTGVSESGIATLRIPWDQAAAAMVAVLGTEGPPILLVSTLDEDGYVGPGDCFSLAETHPSPEVVTHLATKLRAPAILCGTRATRSVLEPDESDIALTHWLIGAAQHSGCELFEHVLVQGQTFRLMRESLADGLI